MSETAWGSWNNGLFVRSWLFRWGCLLDLERLGQTDLGTAELPEISKKKVHKDFGKADTVNFSQVLFWNIAPPNFWLARLVGNEGINLYIGILGMKLTLILTDSHFSPLMENLAQDKHPRHLVFRTKAGVLFSGSCWDAKNWLKVFF